MLVFWDHSFFLTNPKDTARQVAMLPADKTEAQRNGTRSGGLPHSHPHKLCLPPSHLSPDLRCPHPPITPAGEGAAPTPTSPLPGKRAPLL